MHAGNASGIGTPDPGAVASFVVTPSLLDIIVSYLCHCALQQSHTQTPSRGPPRRRREGHCKATVAETGSVAIFLPAASSTLIAIPVKQAPRKTLIMASKIERAEEQEKENNNRQFYQREYFPGVHSRLYRPLRPGVSKLVPESFSKNVPGPGPRPGLVAISLRRLLGCERDSASLYRRANQARVKYRLSILAKISPIGPGEGRYGLRRGNRVCVCVRVGERRASEPSLDLGVIAQAHLWIKREERT